MCHHQGLLMVRLLPRSLGARHSHDAYSYGVQHALIQVSISESVYEDTHTWHESKQARLLRSATTERHAHDISADIVRTWLSGYKLQHRLTRAFDPYPSSSSQCANIHASISESVYEYNDTRVRS
jgi:hypothetical protein